jgi:hypothetical protein
MRRAKPKGVQVPPTGDETERRGARGKKKPDCGVQSTPLPSTQSQESKAFKIPPTSNHVARGESTGSREARVLSREISPVRRESESKSR